MMSSSINVAAKPAGPSGSGASSAPVRRPRIRWFGLRTDLPSWLLRTLAAFSFLAALAIWWWLSQQDFVNKVFVPAPATVWETAKEFFKDDNLWIDVKASLFRVTTGFLLAAALALPLGILIGSFKLFEGLLQPFTEFVRYIPVPALIPILMVLFGIGEMPKVMLIFIGTFFQLVLMVADEIRRVPYDLVQVSYTLGAKRSEVIRLVLFRSAMPGIFDALRLCNGWAWTYLVVAELIAANEGLGYRILKFSRFLQTPKIFVYLILLGIIGLLLDFLFRKFNQRAFHWADTTKR